MPMHGECIQVCASYQYNPINLLVKIMYIVACVILILIYYGNMWYIRIYKNNLQKWQKSKLKLKLWPNLKNIRKMKLVFSSWQRKLKMGVVIQVHVMRHHLINSYNSLGAESCITKCIKHLIVDVDIHIYYLIEDDKYIVAQAYVGF